MSKIPHKLSQVIKQLGLLPGVGEKTAMRYALSLLKWNATHLQELATSLASLADLQKCPECFLYLENDLCLICSDTRRASTGTLCVIETFPDFLAIEKSGHFDGLFHVLGGTLNPLQGRGKEELQLGYLCERIEKRQIRQVLLALNPTLEGDVTSTYIKQLLPAHIVVERPGMGIPVGGNLEYLDGLTILKAIEHRREISS